MLAQPQSSADGQFVALTGFTAVSLLLSTLFRDSCTSCCCWEMDNPDLIIYTDYLTAFAALLPLAAALSSDELIDDIIRFYNCNIFTDLLNKFLVAYATRHVLLAYTLYLYRQYKPQIMLWLHMLLVVAVVAPNENIALLPTACLAVSMMAGALIGLEDISNAFCRQPAHSQQPLISSSKKAPATSAAFFTILPTDLQLLILQAWLGNHDAHQLLALSALDIACCSAAVRPSYLFLAGHSSNFWNSREVQLVVSELSSFMRWLQSRQVKLKWLLLTDQNLQEFMLFLRKRREREGLAAAPPHTLLLLSVQHLVLWKTHNDNKDAITAVLSVCPCTVSLETSSSACVTPTLGDLILGKTNSSEDEQTQLLHSAHTPVPWQVLHIGHALTDECLEMLTKGPPTFLTSLSLFAEASLSTVLAVIASCEHLSHLKLSAFAGTGADLEQVLQAGRHQLRSFTVIAMRPKPSDALALFAEVLERHPWLDCWGIGSYLVHKSAGSLALHITESTDKAMVENICTNAVSSSSGTQITKLKLTGTAINIEVAIILRRHFAKALEELDNEIISSTSMTTISCLLVCSAEKLKKIRLHTLSDPLTGMSDWHLEHFVKEAHSLETLVITGTNTISNKGMEQCIALCPSLKELHLGHAPNITIAGVRAALSHGTVRKLTWDTAGFDAADFLYFDDKDLQKMREEAKPQQMLPVATLDRRMLHGYGDCGVVVY